MTRKSSRSVFRQKHYSATVTLAVLLVIVGTGIVSQGSSQDADNTHVGEIAGVKFVVPAGFHLDQTASPKVSFMRHRSEPLGLFVVIVERQVSDEYLTDVSSDLVTRFHPGKERFRWKIQQTFEPRLSDFQMHRGSIKGLNAKTYVQLDYVVVKAQQKDIVIGSIAQFGEEGTASFLFDAKGREYSVPGWEGLFQLIFSVTGEKDLRRGNH